MSFWTKIRSESMCNGDKATAPCLGKMENHQRKLSSFDVSSLAYMYVTMYVSNIVLCHFLYTKLTHCIKFHIFARLVRLFFSLAFKVCSAVHICIHYSSNLNLVMVKGWVFTRNNQNLKKKSLNSDITLKHSRYSGALPLDLAYPRFFDS